MFKKWKKERIGENKVNTNLNMMEMTLMKKLKDFRVIAREILMEGRIGECDFLVAKIYGNKYKIILMEFNQKIYWDLYEAFELRPVDWESGKQAPKVVNEIFRKIKSMGELLEC